MPVTYTNRKGVTYYLCRGTTKTGKPRYYFARKIKGEPVEEMPEGYEIRESVNAIVSLAKARPKQILTEEVEAVEAALERHSKRKNYRVGVQPRRIDIYERVGVDAEDLTSKLGLTAGQDSDIIRRIQIEQERYSQFTPVLRFILVDEEERIFRVERMCYLGSVDDWIDIGLSGPINELTPQLIPTLGTDDFYELY